MNTTDAGGNDEWYDCTATYACIALLVIVYVFYGFYIVTDVYLVTVSSCEM